MLRTAAVLTLVFTLASPLARAEDHFTKVKNTSVPDEPTAGMALVYLFRPSLAAGAHQSWAFLDDELLMVSRGRAYSVSLAPEGRHTLWLYADATWTNLDQGSRAEVVLEGASTYYFEIDVRQALFRMRLAIVPVDEKRAEKLLAKSDFVEPTAEGRRRAGEIAAEHRPRAASPAEGLEIPFLAQDEPAWEVGHSDENDTVRVLELVRSGETVESWTELATLMTWNKAAGVGSLDDHLAAYREEVAGSCPGSTWEVLREEADGVLYELRVLDCEEGADEAILGRVLEGADNRFVLQYAVRPPASMTPERRAEWIEKLSAVQIMRLPAPAGGR